VNNLCGVLFLFSNVLPNILFIVILHCWSTRYFCLTFKLLFIMAEDAKTYVFDSASRSSMDPTALLAMMNNGGFGGGNWMWIIFLFFLYGWGGNGLFGRNGTGMLGNELNNDYGRTLLLQAINGNGTAISQLATTLNSDINSVRDAINSVQMSISTVGNQVGMSAAQVTSAIQSGNQTLGAQLAQCCCDNKLLVTTQGYENQIATLNQTNQLGSKIDANSNTITAAISNQTIEMNNQFAALKERELQNKIDSLTAANTSLQNTISNANQTAAIQAYVASVVNPIATDVAAIKAAQPSTATVQYPQLTAIPSYYLYGGTSSLLNGSLWA
jgi:hypothetical protein